MKVLMTADCVGGVWTYALELCRGLAPYGVEVVLVAKGGPLSGDQRREVSTLAHVELEESGFRLEWQPDPWEDVTRCSEWLLDLTEEKAPDLIHLNDFAHGSLPWGRPSLVVGHSCVVSWWKAVHKAAPPPVWNEYADRVREGLQGTDVVVAPSRAMLKSLFVNYGPFRDGRVIYNGRSHDGAPPGRKDPMVLSAGRLWDEGKNVSSLEAIAAAVPWPVYLAGDGRTPGRAQPHGAHALGRLTSAELRGWLKRASIFALPARYEPFGLSILEAAQEGCALVLGDIDSLRELWDGAALFVPPEGGEPLLRALKRLTSDPQGLARLADAARTRARRYGPGAMAEQYVKLYREIATHGRGAHEAPACAS